METKIERFKVVEYDGSIESYNKLVDYIESSQPKSEKHTFWHISFLDERHSPTNKFTGIVYDYHKGIVYKPGDVYHVPIKE